MICVGPSASAVYIPPTFTRAASTNFNQNSGVLNGTVATTGNRAITSVEFQWSTSSTFASGNSAWTAASTNTTISQGATNTSRAGNATSLIANTNYYVRFRATNASGLIATSAISDSTSNGNFKTYKLNTATFTGSSTWTNPVPTSGTSGLAITQLLNLECRAGGGAGAYLRGAGGGAGARTTSSSATISGNVTVTIGAGGSGSSVTAGGTTSIGSVLSASGGQIGGNGGFFGLPPTPGGSSGNGNPGGSSAAEDRDGAGGGGGGTNGAGGNATVVGLTSYRGSGGAGWATGLGVGGIGSDITNGAFDAGDDGPAYSGNGGGGAANIFINDNFDPARGGNGGSGYAQFQYYGP